MGVSPRPRIEQATKTKDDRSNWILALVGIVAVTFVAILIVIFTWGDSYNGNHETTVERFHRVCEEHGGFVAQTGDPSLFTTGRIDCIVDNEVIYLPGFA